MGCINVFLSTVRIYVFCQAFPIPRDSSKSVNQKGRRYELIDMDDYRDIALHHVIRQKGKMHSRRIAEFDKLFGENRPEAITDAEVPY